ncbi:MAG TPA: haloacid dehalogenase [Actinobacteria bacterium]|nr:haloacid dehalogenase [Actinomycetota bacterium]
MRGPEPLDLGELDAVVRARLDQAYEAREAAIRDCRQIIRSSANAIRALHRGETAAAEGLLAEAEALVEETNRVLAGHPELRAGGFVWDAVKEYAEARLTEALLTGRPLPLPDELGIDVVPYLKGLGEAVGELRRRLLDELRTGELASARAVFEQMEAIYDLLASLDYPDGMTAGLRRTTDVARSLIERSRADLTTTAVQDRLRRRLSEVVERLGDG